MIIYVCVLVHRSGTVKSVRLFGEQPTDTPSGHIWLLYDSFEGASEDSARHDALRAIMADPILWSWYERTRRGETGAPQRRSRQQTTEGHCRVSQVYPSTDRPFTDVRIPAVGPRGARG